MEEGSQILISRIVSLTIGVLLKPQLLPPSPKKERNKEKRTLSGLRNRKGKWIIIFFLARGRCALSLDSSFSLGGRFRVTYQPHYEQQRDGYGMSFLFPHPYLVVTLRNFFFFWRNPSKHLCVPTFPSHSIFLFYNILKFDLKYIIH